MIRVEAVAMSKHLDSSIADEALVVNSARISFGKRVKHLDERDRKLINFLARNNHWTPFGHPHVTLYVRAPVFVARQLGKHQVGFVWNEISRRYVDFDPGFFYPEWRERVANKKQGSGETITGRREWLANKALDAVVATSRWAYHLLLRLNVAPEVARAVLPQTMYTEWFWTGSLYGWSRVVNLRLDPHAQEESRIAAGQIDAIMRDLYPVSWEELMDGTA